MHVPAYALGFTAGKMLVRLITGKESVVGSVVMQAELIILSSFGAGLQPTSVGQTEE